MALIIIHVRKEVVLKRETGLCGDIAIALVRDSRRGGRWLATFWRSGADSALTISSLRRMHSCVKSVKIRFKVGSSVFLRE
jgi:hypothetical protein